MKNKEKLERLEKANEFIEVVSGCGRRFFYNNGVIAKFVLSEHGRVFLVDEWTQKKVYTHIDNQEWKNFSGGGTLKGLIIALREFIMHGQRLSAWRFRPVLPNGFENPWGYGNDILIVHDAAIRIGVAKKIDACAR
ncbi:hypothetical protein [Sessilibacter corallicola]|uniref:hypothetical protein n=1 Tax=Sessilibacter corallicola TaxID=2904075 RepID=UPI001E5EF539|nr:hypothetical protein [Sessilibacter corallicola]MCE2029263.1 hypothetical protein [Sessilibacter corallicola]